MNTLSSLYRSQAGYSAAMAQYDAALARCNVPYEPLAIETRYGPTCVLAAGPQRARPIVLLHGWNGNAAEWLLGRLLAPLMREYRVYMPDVIGQLGKSAPCRPSTKGTAYGEWMDDLLTGLDVGPVTIVGISGGGWITMKTAAFAPQRVASAVALSAAGLVPPRWQFLLPTALAAVRPSEANVRRFARLVSSPTVPFNAQYARNLTVVFRHHRLQNAPPVLSDAELSRISSPMLLLMGEYERVFRPEAAMARARARIPGLVAAEIVPGAGHVLHGDQPAVVCERLLRFLAQGR